MISPPEGWVETATQDSHSTQTSSAKPQVAPSSVKPAPVAQKPSPLCETARETPPIMPPPVQAVAAAVIVPPGRQPEAMVGGSSGPAPTKAGGLKAPGDLSPPPAAAPPSTEGPQAVAVKMGFTPFTVPQVVAGETYLSALTRSFVGRVAVVAISGVVGLAGVYGFWKLIAHHQAPPAVQTGEQPATGAATPGAADQENALPEQVNRRWLPDQTICLLDVRMSSLAQRPEAAAAPVLGRYFQLDLPLLLFSLNVREEQVRRLTWATADLGDVWKDGVAVLALERGVDAVKILPKGDQVPFGGGLVGRRLPGVGRSSAVVAADAHTLVVGNEDLLRRLAVRNGDAQLSSGPMDLLLKKLVPTGELSFFLDLAAVRTGASKLADWLEVWPDGRRSWRLACETPLALGLSVRMTGNHRCELGLACPSESRAEASPGERSAEILRMEIEKLLDAAARALPGHIAVLKELLPPEKIGAEAAAEYRSVLDDLLTSLHSYGCETSDGIVWLRMNWSGQGLASWAVAFLECKAAWTADRLIASRAADEENHRNLLRALGKYAAAEKPERFPAGAAEGARRLQPETRLSWIASLAPLLGHDDWKLSFAENWDGPKNRPYTQRPLPEVVNPAFGRARAGEYPVTHYVGAAGVGDDAAGLPADDPRAGIFGYERQTRLQDLVRGGANTIAVLGVQEKCGPWAQGGRATVRALTQAPYVNGPDGFGSGQAEGMVVGMADGSARFISRDIDPKTMECLATLRGGDLVDASALDGQPRPPPQPPRAESPPPPAQPPAAAAKPAAALDPRLRERLNKPVQKITINGMPFRDAVQLAAAVAALPVSFDADALEELGVSLRDPVSIEAADATVGALLDRIAAARDMAWTVENGQVLLTSKPAFREELKTVRYTVADLTAADAAGRPRSGSAADLARLLQRFVAPSSWQTAQGPGAIEISPDALRITQTGSVHHQIVVFCEKLRVARGLAPRSRLDPKAFSLTTRTDRAKPILGQPASINVGTATPLREILAMFKLPGGAEILIDRPALAAAGVNENTPTKLRSENFLGIVLRQLLEPLGLAWRAVDADLLQVTSQKAADSRLEVEFYPVGKRLAGQPPAALEEQIRSGVRGAPWGESGATAAIAFDPPSQCLIVLQTQAAQVAIEAMLSQGDK